MVELKVGQKLWLASSVRYLTSQEVTVTKVGRKWASLDIAGGRYRIRKETLDLDNGGIGASPGRCYLSREVYDAKIALNSEWQVFVSKIDHRVPSGMTVERIKQAAEILGIK